MNKSEALAVLDAHDAVHGPIAAGVDAVHAAEARAKLELSGVLRYLLSKVRDDASASEKAAD